MQKQRLDVQGILPEVDLIKDRDLRDGVITVWQELWHESEWQDIEQLPTSPEIPSPHLPHNRAVVAMALAVADVYEQYHGVTVDRDVLIAAALLQDASKLVEMSPNSDGTARWTSIGRFYQHGFWAAHIALCRGLPHAVSHIILTHTPRSPVFPESLEGKILYYVDQLDVLAIHRDRWRKEVYVTDRQV